MHRSFAVLSLALLLSACKGDDDTDDTDVTGDPGALVRVTMDSTVGVLLDEFPEGAVRDRAAAMYLAEGDAFWEARARRQTDLTYYRLVYRHFFYEDRGQLPLPPDTEWTIALGGPATRTTIDGHDVVVRDYSFESVMISPEASPGESEPVLGTVGGTYDEPFVFPVDPELLFQRVGYACADESDYPVGSVDPENVQSFYDQDCDVEDSESQYCHWTDFPDQSCVEALTEHVGKIETAVHFERIAWDDVVADQYRFGEITSDTGADLKIYEPGLQNHRVIYRYFEEDACAVDEGCLGGTGWRRLLQFDAISHNVGSGPMHIGDVDYYISGEGTAADEHNLYEYSECHAHYHFSHYGAFYWGEQDEMIGGKRAFCLESTNRLSNNEITPLSTPYGSCEFQGIEAGWGDMYQAGLECQWIDITDVDTSTGPKTAPLKSVANPDDLMCEGTVVTDENGDPVWVATEFTTEDGDTVDTIECTFVEDHTANNEDEVPVTIPEDGDGLVTTDCRYDPVGPKRDCGFDLQRIEQTCTPGETVDLLCSVADPAEPMVARICDYSDALGTELSCAFHESLANVVVTTDTPLSFTCPAARGDEPGGRVSTLIAPLVEGDEVQLFGCEPVAQN